MAVPITLAQLENWMRGKAEESAARAAKRELASVRAALVTHERVYVHTKKEA